MSASDTEAKEEVCPICKKEFDGDDNRKFLSSSRKVLIQSMHQVGSDVRRM